MELILVFLPPSLIQRCSLMAPGDGVIARFLFQMWDATAARTSAGAVGPHGGIAIQPGFLEAWWLGSQGGWRSPESELGEGSQYKLMLYP